MSHPVAPPDVATWAPVVGLEGYQFLLDLYERTGGTTDGISDLEDGELYEQGIESAAIEDAISDIEVDDSISQPFRDWRSFSTMESVTANAFEFIAVTGNCVIYLPEYPDSDDIVSVLNVYGNNVTVDGNGKYINDDLSTISRRKNTTINYHYFAELGKWYMR